MGPRAFLRAALAVACVVVAGGACDFRSCLAQSELFKGFRPELIDQCCRCLANNGTRHPGAACAATFIDSDGGLAIIADAGPAIPIDGGPVVPDDGDGNIEADEVPCLCEDNLAQCKAALTKGDSLLITGSCISQGGGLFVKAPCEDACDGVLTFDPLTSGP